MLSLTSFGSRLVTRVAQTTASKSGYDVNISILDRAGQRLYSALISQKLTILCIANIFLAYEYIWDRKNRQFGTHRHLLEESLEFILHR